MQTFTLLLALGMLTCTLPAHKCLGQATEASKPWSSRNGDRFGAITAHPNRFVYRLPTIRSRMSAASCYIRFANYILALKDRKAAIKLALRTFQNIRDSGDIVNENIFVSKITYLIIEDTTLIPLSMSMMDQVAIDNDSLLPQVTDKELQRDVVNQMAENGCTYAYAPRTDISIRYEMMAIRLNERLHQHAAFPYQNLSFLYTTQGRQKDALALALDAMRVSETPSGVVDASGYESLARVHFMTGDFDKCVEFSKKAFSLYFKDHSKVEYVGVLVFRYIQVLLQQQKAAEALRFVRSLNDPSSSHEPTDGEEASFALARAECFRVLHQPDSAERYYRLTFALKPPLPASWFRTSPYVCLATFYTENRQYVRAERVLDTLLNKNFRSVIPAVFLAQTLLLRYRVDSALRNYPRAMAALSEYHRLHDSLTNYRLNKQLADLTTRSETEKTAQHIADLEQQSALQGRLQQSALRQDRLVRNCLIAGAALLGLFAVVLYNRWRTRRQMSLKLQKANTAQEKLLGEKEWLLREIHHRVKNNLQVIISLLAMQTDQLKDEIAISAFEQIGARINTICLMHKKLYQGTQDMAAVDMRDYIRELVGFLKASIASRQSIAFNIDVPQLVLDPRQCVPLGLILNEAITNAIKYAFRDDATRSPIINISLKQEPESCINLVVADNGIGLPASFDPNNSDSLGLQLIQNLTLQLDGTLEMINQADLSDPDAPRGLALRVRFPYKSPLFSSATA